MADPAAAENLAAFHIEAVNILRWGGEGLNQFILKLGCYPMISIQRDEPFVLERKVFERPTPLFGMPFETC